MSYKTDKPLQVPCVKCKKRHKPDQSCRLDKPAANSKLAPLVFTNLALSKITTQDELNQYITESKKSIGACPSCKKSHSFEKSFPFGKAKVASSRMSSCDDFMKKSA